MAKRVTDWQHFKSLKQNTDKIYDRTRAKLELYNIYCLNAFQYQHCWLGTIFISFDRITWKDKVILIDKSNTLVFIYTVLVLKYECILFLHLRLGAIIDIRMFSYLFLPTSSVIHLFFIVLTNHSETQENISDKRMLI